MELVTGRTGTPHITSQQDRQLHQGIWGDEAYILNTGNMLEPEVQSSNKILIKDGALMYQGALFSVKVGTTDEVTINNGNQGMKRKDLVAVRYKYDSAQNIETGEWVVIQGTPAESNPVAPSGTSGNIQNGDATVDCPVFIVNLDGINVTGVDIIPEVVPDIPTLNADLSELTDKINSPILTTKEYPVTLTYNQYVSSGYWNNNWSIPAEDVAEYGVPVSIMFRNKDASPGSAVFQYNSQRWCCFAGNSTTGIAVVSYLKY